ncbi:MAG: hypothetical protein EOO52_13280 [Gammaproteobacteria bacterium]|nr:MAG: hypothetical protein EOO52_13280 [Gammaproteobacteria bacterium]
MLEALVKDEGTKFSFLGKSIVTLIAICILLFIAAFVQTIYESFDASETAILKASSNKCVKDQILSSSYKNGALTNYQIKVFVRECELKEEHDKQVSVIK